MQQPRQVRIIVENIEGLSASAVLDQAGTLWLVIAENEPRPYHAAADVLAEALGADSLALTEGRADVTIEFGPSCTRWQPAPPARLRLVA